MLVKLEDYEVRNAISVGTDRHMEARRSGNADIHGARGISFEAGFLLHIHAAGGELAAAKVLNRYWHASVNTYHRVPDVGDNLEVRTRLDSICKNGADADLIVRDDDPDDRYFVHVIGRLPEYEVVGWILGADAKQQQWRNNHGGHGEAYFVPRSQLSHLNGGEA